MRLHITRNLVLFGIILTLIGCGGPEARKAKYTARAQQYVQEENWPKARVALRNVLKIDPNDAEANFLYAMVEEKEKNWLNAFRYYLKVAELHPDHREARIKLGRFYLEGGLIDRVTETADQILLKYPGDPGAETLRAAALAKKGQKAEALSRIEAVNRRHPHEPDAASLLTALYTDQRRLGDAETVLRKALEGRPRNVILLSNLGDTLVRLGRLDEAEETLKRLLEAEPKVFDHRVRMAAFYNHRNDLVKAEAVLGEAVRLDPENEHRRLVFAEFMTTQKDPKAGEAILLKAMNDLSRSTKIRFALGKLYETTDQRLKARHLYEEMVDQEGKEPAGLEAQVKLASLDLVDGKKEEAARRVKEVLQENPTASDALVLQGRMALAREEGKEAVQAFRTVLKDQPERADVHALLGQAYLQTGEPTLARESLEKAIALSPRQIGARRVLVRLDLEEGRKKEARRGIETILAEAPTDREALLFLIGLQTSAQEWKGAEATLAKLRASGVEPFVTDLAEGELHQARKEWMPAIAAFERAKAARPEAAEPLFALVRIELGLGKTEEAFRRLEKVVARHPEHPYAHGMLGEILLLKKEFARAEEEFMTANRLRPDWVIPWLDRAKLKIIQKNPTEAASILESALQANPKSSELRLLLASIYNETDQVDRAIGTYEAILKDQPKSVVAANNLASLLTDRKGDPKSLERALALTRDFEKNAPEAAFLDTLGWVYVKMGQPDEGVRLLRRVVEKVPDHPVFQYHLGIAYHQAGEAKKAKAALKKAVASGKHFPGLDEAQTILARMKE